MYTKCNARVSVREAIKYLLLNKSEHSVAVPNVKRFIIFLSHQVESWHSQSMQIQVATNEGLYYQRQPLIRKQYDKEAHTLSIGIVKWCIIP